MADERERGIGKCVEDHLGSYGYPTRPEEPYQFCPQCGNEMIWRCPGCGAPVPEDSDELTAARFCRDCGTPYFGANRSALRPDGEGAQPSK